MGSNEVSLDKSNLFDYALPMMMVEKALRDIHDLCLEGQYAKAKDETVKMQAQVTVLYANLTVMDRGTK